MRFIAFDTETTGMDPCQDRIIELCLREVKWPLLQSVETLNFFLNPGVPIPAEATKVHGYRDRDVAGCPRFGEAAQRIQEFVDGAALIAYNGRRFDVPLLHHELVRAGQKGLPVDVLVIDPYEVFLRDVPHTLAGALKHYMDEEHPDAHEAEADVDAMLAVLLAQVLLHPATEILERARNPDRRRLDHSGCFYQDQDGVVRFGFGKHRGQEATSRPEYLRWMLNQGFSAEALGVARGVLRRLGAAE